MGEQLSASDLDVLRFTLRASRRFLQERIRYEVRRWALDEHEDQPIERRVKAAGDALAAFDRLVGPWADLA